MPSMHIESQILSLVSFCNLLSTTTTITTSLDPHYHDIHNHEIMVGNVINANSIPHLHETVNEPISELASKYTIYDLRFMIHDSRI